MKLRYTPAIMTSHHMRYAILALVVFVIAGLYVFHLFIPWTVPADIGIIEVTIQRGMTPSDISALLKESGVIRSEKKFLFGAKLLGVTRKLQAGRYVFQGRLNNYAVLSKLFKGDVVTEQVTIPEGSRATKIAGILNEALNIDSVRFVSLVYDSSYSRAQDVIASTLEGYLYPDTYRFHTNTSPEEAIQRMVSRFREVFHDSLIQRAGQIGMTVHQVITLASIVEGEAALDSERSIIAALYMNRLKRNMLLQADPTIQYIIKDSPRRLLNKDLQIDSPYNTYIYPGLPPGPVNSPGIASILAVLYPDTVNYLYMVANGDGSHTFSKTIREHLQAKARFDRVRRNSTRYRR